MNGSIKKKIIEALKDQKEIFGDELFAHLSINVKSEKDESKKAVKKEKFVKKNEPSYEEMTEAYKLKSRKADASVEIDKSKYIDVENSKNLDELAAAIKNCQKCKLAPTRKNLVFGKGSKNADVMVIGEGPGAEEDLQGEPFVGRAGQLLTDILKAIKFSREETYIANIVKCRPPSNRNPQPDEIASCIPHLKKQIELIKPKAILCLGLVAATSLLKEKKTLTAFRGQIFDYEGVKVMVTYHPAALLRNPGWKKGCWDDVQNFRKLYDDIIKA